MLTWESAYVVKQNMSKYLMTGLVWVARGLISCLEEIYLTGYSFFYAKLVLKIIHYLLKKIGEFYCALRR